MIWSWTWIASRSCSSCWLMLPAVCRKLEPSSKSELDDGDDHDGADMLVRRRPPAIPATTSSMRRPASQTWAAGVTLCRSVAPARARSACGLVAQTSAMTRTMLRQVWRAPLTTALQIVHGEGARRRRGPRPAARFCPLEGRVERPSPRRGTVSGGRGEAAAVAVGRRSVGRGVHALLGRTSRAARVRDAPRGKNASPYGYRVPPAADN